MVGNLKQRLWSEISERREELIQLCAETVRLASPNPPGDTTAIADFVEEYLSSLSLSVERIEPKQGAPNLVASTNLSGHPHLVFNSHLDTFPAAHGAWSHPPFGGVIHGGRIYGCGATDMKAGLAISLFVATLVTRSGHDLSGRLTFSYSSDEETGGRWGTEWLVSNLASIRGDACVIGDQSGSSKISVGEKGMCWLHMSFEGQSSHAAYGSSSSATRKLSHALPILYSLEEMRSRDRVLPGVDPLRDSVTVNVGRLDGGVSPNLVADRATAEVDIRIPHGLSVVEVVTELRHRLDETGIVCEVEILRATDPTMTDPSSKVVKIAIENASKVLGGSPELAMRLGASDARFFRQAEIPTIVYGPEAHNMGAPNEYVDIDELLLIARVHTGIVADFLRAG